MKKSIALAMLLTFMLASPSRANVSSLYIVLDSTHTGMKYYINGKTVDKDKIFEEMSRYVIIANRNQKPVNMLINIDLQLSKYWDLLGQLQAVGFQRIKKYVFNKKTKMMVEIDVKGTAIPIPIKLP